MNLIQIYVRVMFFLLLYDKILFNSCIYCEIIFVVVRYFVYLRIQIQSHPILVPVSRIRAAYVCTKQLTNFGPVPDIVNQD